MDQAGSVAGGEVGPDAKQNGADWRDTSRVRPAQIVPRHTQGWVLVHTAEEVVFFFCAYTIWF